MQTTFYLKQACYTAMLMCFIFSANLSFANAPTTLTGSDACSIAVTDITNTCSTGDLSSATNEGTLPNNPGCGNGDFVRTCSGGFSPSSNYEDIWYQIDNTVNSDEVTVDITGLTGAEEVIVFLFDACNSQLPHGNEANSVTNPPGGANAGDCAVFNSSNTSFTFHNLTGISPIYVRVMPYVNASNCSGLVNASNFMVCTTIPQPNDECGNAIDIATNNGGVASTGNLEAAAAENGDESDCSSMALAGGDLWYVVNTPNSASASDQFVVDYTISGGSAGAMVIAKLYTSCFFGLEACEALTLDGAGMASTNFGGETLFRNADYFIQLIYVSGSLSNVTSSATVSPENNNCEHFSTTFPGFDLADDSAVLNLAFATDNDLWYQIDHSSNQSIEISISDTNWDGEVSVILYEYDDSNLDCDNLVEHCRADNVDDFAFESGLIFGLGTADYLVQVIETTPDSGGDPLDVTISGVLSTATILANSVCTGALDITNGSQTGNFTESAIPCPLVSLMDCDGNNISSTPFDDYYGAMMWYSFDVPAENCTQLTTSTGITAASIDINGLTTNTGSGTKNAYVQLWDDCNNVVDCTTANNSTNADFTGLIPGQTYYVQIINNTLSSTGTADFTVEEVIFPDPAPCNDDVSSPFDLGSTYNSGSDYSGSGVCLGGPYSAAGATSNSAGVNQPGVNSNNVWFEFTAANNADERGYASIYVQSLSNGGGNPYVLTINVYEEVGGSGGISLVGSGSTNTDGDGWVDLGHLDIGEDYFIEIVHSQAGATQVLYDLCIYDTPTTSIPCPSNGVSITPADGSQCGDITNDCGLYYRIELPANEPSGWYRFEVIGNNGVDLDAEVFGQGMDSPIATGSPTDYDQPCNPSHALATGGPTGALADPGSCNGGSGEYVTYNLIGSSTAESNYYYLEVSDASTAGPGCNLTAADICSINVYGPYTTSALAAAGGTPDQACGGVKTVEVQVKVFLQGPLNGTTMNTDLQPLGFVPLMDPYGLGESVGSIATDIVDWVKVELRGTANTSIIGTRACLLRNDGQVIDPTDGTTTIKFENISVGITSGYVAVHHRNHLAVMNGTAVSF